MSIVISIYSKNAFKEVLLPSLNNADYSIKLEKEYFTLSQDVVLNLEVMNHMWSVKQDSEYQLFKDIANHIGQPLANGDLLRLVIRKTEAVSLIVKEVSSVFHAYEKFYLTDVDRLSIGKNYNNDIVYDYRGSVSKHHAMIERRGDDFWITNKSTNGTYINSVRMQDERKLEFGDYINIMGLHLIFLKDLLAVDVHDKNIIINTQKLVHMDYFKTEEDDSQETMISDGKNLYHRAPRNYERLEEGIIEIEEPPVLDPLRRTSFFMTIGPSFTMALPMILGCILMISAGSTSSGFYKYSGLIVSVFSALIGVIWGIINMNAQKKEVKAKIQKRSDVYGQYLVDKTEEIKNKYEASIHLLERKYPDANTALSHDQSTGSLWNRNWSHEDFLTHRMGRGDIPFQINISIPKKRFQMELDELAEKPAKIKERYGTLYGVPVTLDYKKYNIIGIIGGKDKIGAFEVAQTMSAQIAAGNCYTDVKLGYFYDGSSSVEREYFDAARWFPHTWSEDKRTRFMASNKEEASDVFYELANIFRTRSENAAMDRRNQKEVRPYYILFISDTSLLEGELFLKYVFQKEQNIGLTVVLLTERYEELPNSCEYIIQNDSSFQGMYGIFDREDEKQVIAFDQTDHALFVKFAEQIAGTQVLELESGGEIPNSLSFFDMLGVNKLEELRVQELWAKNRIYENIRGILGQKAGGAPCYLDVHEKYHGPHGLIAGTTGSGKSETLQTYMLSLAVNYSPDDIGFFVIDYKGGGMAHLFDGLPHMIGQISNLSGNQVKRAMISIKSENRRRQKVFNENGVNNINAYTRLYKNGEAGMPIPHLFIIIDEFAELKREEPEFMKELISVAQVGRSLGVHLILATQKPSGTVDDNIWSNSKFRLCLRVQDKKDSNDMIHKPDAAYITQTGRGYLQVGSDEVYELFQSGYSGATYDKNADHSIDNIAKMLGINGKVEMTGNMAKSSRKRKAQYDWIEQLCDTLFLAKNKMMQNLHQIIMDKNAVHKCAMIMYEIMEENGMEYIKSDYNTRRLVEFMGIVDLISRDNPKDYPRAIMKYAANMKVKLPETKEKSQLEAVKEYLAVVAQENGYARQQQLWMPILGEQIYLDEFDEFVENSFTYSGWTEQAGDWSMEMLLGKMDDPENQDQMPLIIDFAKDGNIAICGNIVSGKSTMMQTMIYSLIQRYTPEWVNIYGLDFSSRMMSAFEKAPHVGGIMYENDEDRISKFFNMIMNILAERKELLRGGNYIQYVQVHGVKLPAIVIFIDNYISFKQKTEEQYEDLMIQLSKEGVNHGIFLVVSGTGFGMNDITQRVGENLNTTLCLALQDRFAYSELLHTMQLSVLPEGGIKGRGLACYGERILEYQTCLSIHAENDYQRMERIREQCEKMAQAWTKKGARKIPEIPEKPTWKVFEALEDFEKMVEDKHWVPVGYNADNAAVYGISLKDNYCYTIWGSRKTGKTNLMRIYLQSVLKKDSIVSIIDSPDGILRSYEDVDGLQYFAEDESIYNFFKDLLPEFVRRNQRKRQMLEEELEEDEIFENMSEEKPYFIFISDLSWFVPFVNDSEYGRMIKGFLENIFEKGQLHNIYFITEMSVEMKDAAAGYPIYELFTGYKTGIHLGGRVNESPKLNFDYIPFLEQGKTEKIGIGQIPNATQEDDVRKIVIPNVRG